MGAVLNRQAKGKRLENLAKEWLETKGFLVQLCPNQVVWVPDKKRPPKIIRGRPVYPRIPVAVAKDFFSIWDGCYVDPDGRAQRRGYFQVTVWAKVSEKRKDILASKFPCNAHDMILGYVEGRGRHFRVLRGPWFEKDEGERLEGALGGSDVGMA